MDNYIKFQNGSLIKALHSNSNVRCNRSKIIGSQCYDIETGQFVFRELDTTKLIERYIPEYLFLGWLENQ